MTPESLAADFERIASWMATRPNGVTWTGDGLDGTVAGLRDAAKSIREHLAPAWAVLVTGRDAAEARERMATMALAEEIAELRAQRDQARADRDLARAETVAMGQHLDRVRAERDQLAARLRDGDGSGL